MTDLDVSLLVAAMRFAGRGVDALVTTVCPDPATMLEGILGHAPSAEQVTALQGIQSQVQLDLDAATTARGQLDTGMAAVPASLSEVTAVAAALAEVLRRVATAAGRIATAVTDAPGPDAAMQSLLRESLAASTFGGLVTQLGLPAAGADVGSALTVAGTLVMCTVGNADERGIGDAELFSLHDSRFDGFFDWTSPTSLKLKLATGLRVGVTPDDFVHTLLGNKGTVDTRVTVTVDAVKGIVLGEGTRHRLAIPGQINLAGYVQLSDLALVLPEPGELSGGADRPGFQVVATLTGALGPVKAVVDGVGVALVVDSDAVEAGAAEPALLTVLPPIGAGLSINAGVVHGGGYVMHSGTEYGGALDLAIGPIEIKAFGLIGTDPFSLVVVLSVQFRPGIQLSFGFTLNGVGGLLALQRTLDSDALAAGLRTHAVDNLLFPADPVAIAPQLLRMLDAVFPPYLGGFVAGPMVEAGWGEPISYVTARLGILISLPDPKIIILGSLRLALPTPEAAIVDLHAEVIGEISSDHILVLVSLAGSRIAGFAISGDFGILIAYGDQPDFVMSAGGFHPHYQPPHELTGMQRVSIDLSPPAVLTVQARAYLALTANSFQLGAQVQLRADVGVAGAEGHLAFDAIVRWAPTFSFEIDLSAGFSIYALGTSFAGVDLHLHLEGPAPWNAHGTASISLLFFDLDIDVGPITWGDGANAQLDAKSPVDMVVAELRKAGSWHPVVPGSGDRVATLITDSVPDAVLVHPLGAFEVRQHVIPLETVITHVGANPVSDPRVNLGSPTVGGVDVAAVSATTDRFPPAQFLSLTDDEKLSRPAFEDFPSGARFSGVSDEASGAPVGSSYQWNTVVPHAATTSIFKDEVISSLFTLTKVVAAMPAARGGARAAQPYAVPSAPVSYAAAGSVLLRSTQDLHEVDGVDPGPMTTTAAAELLDGLVVGNEVPRGAVEMVSLGVAP
jgi:hypothetical protein